MRPARQSDATFVIQQFLNSSENGTKFSVLRIQGPRGCGKSFVLNSALQIFGTDVVLRELSAADIFARISSNDGSTQLQRVLVSSCRPHPGMEGKDGRIVVCRLQEAQLLLSSSGTTGDGGEAVPSLDYFDDSLLLDLMHLKECDEVDKVMSALTTVNEHGSREDRRTTATWVPEGVSRLVLVLECSTNPYISATSRNDSAPSSASHEVSTAGPSL